CDLSVVVPTRNEVANLPALHRELSSALAGINYEVVVVDDSTDEGTRPTLRQIVAGDRRWRSVERPAAERRGLGTAVSLGMAMARGDAVCVMDADLQHPPAAIPRLLAAIHGGADLAVGSRYMAGGSAVGLASPYRRAVSRGVAAVGQVLFPECRRSSDPLSGFFCVRRRAVAGLQLRPIGFKILLELLVCLPRIRVRDVPYTFGPRFSGESKASLGQGLLFGKHLLSLFVYVPLAGLLAKVAFSAGAGMVVFVIAIAVLKDVPVHGPVPWLLASSASLGTSLAAYGLMTFRTAIWRRGMGGQRMMWAIGLTCVLGGILGFAVLAVKARVATVVVALVAQLLALALGWGLVRYAQRRDRRAMPLPSAAEELSLHALAERLGAERAFWADPLSPTAGSWRAENLVTEDILAHVARTGQPLLTVELPSCRPQARVNVENLSLMLIPHFGQGHTVTRVAVLQRGGRGPFSTRDLQLALQWFSQRQATYLPVSTELSPELRRSEAS
ncbi:MAG: polyprenol monophosphomannose synthase, partial [Candidatus Dormibacteria bacterium]